MRISGEKFDFDLGYRVRFRYWIENKITVMDLQENEGCKYRTEEATNGERRHSNPRFVTEIFKPTDTEVKKEKPEGQNLDV